jgi:hypothetical protein
VCCSSSGEWYIGRVKLRLSFHYLLLAPDLLVLFSSYCVCDYIMADVPGPEQEPDPIVGLLNGLLTSAMIELTLLGLSIQYHRDMPSSKLLTFPGH